MKRTLLLISSISVLYFGCQSESTITGVNDNSEINTQIAISLQEGILSAPPPILVNRPSYEIIKAAEKVIPIDASNGITIGALERDRSETSCLVSYQNNTIYELYPFLLTNKGWIKGNLIEHIDFNKHDIKSLTKTLDYTNNVGKVWSMDGTSDIPAGAKDAGGIYESGDYEALWGALGTSCPGGYDEDDALKNAVAYEGTMHNNNSTWTVTFTSWVVERIDNPYECFDIIYRGKYSTNLSVDCRWDFGEDTFGSNMVSMFYNLDVVPDPPPPPTPTLSSQVNGTGYIALSWTQSSGATGYKIYKSNSSTGSWYLKKTINSGSTTSWTDTSELPDNTRWGIPKNRRFKIKAFNNYGSSGYSNIRQETIWVEGLRIEK